MDIHLSLEGRRDLAGQIYRQFRDAIRDGRLIEDGLQLLRHLLNFS